jgi:hypothetical protein
LGEDFVNETEKVFNRIAANPEQFPKVKNKQIRKAKTERFPFGIYFAVKVPFINILAVFHNSRNPWQINKIFDA